MLYSTVELVTQVTLNSNLAFCFCNIIIVFLLIERATSSSYSGLSTNDPLPVHLNPHEAENNYEKYGNALNDDTIEGFVLEAQVQEETEAVTEAETEKPEANEEKAAEEETEPAKTVTEAETEKPEANEEKAVEEETEPAKTVAEAAENKQEEEEQEEQEEKEVYDEELRIRIEEFINKINREWRAEKLRACCEVH